MISITFHGAAKTVTGSKYRVQAGKDALLVDCGMFQGTKELRLQNWAPPPFEASDLRWIVLTHSHSDHLGYLPRLHRSGFRGTIYCSAPTKRLAEILLLDAAHLHEEDARYLNKTKATRHSPALPLFDTSEARETLRLFKSVPMEKTVTLSKHLAFRLRPSGHILGACSVQVTATDNARTRTIIFSGDIGRYDMPLIPDPESPEPCDYLVVESTYGDRLHDDVDPMEAMAKLVRRSIDSGGVLLIPSFAVGRTQQIVHMLKRLEREGRIPEIPIHVDSPMAIDATEIFCDFPDLHRVSLSEQGGAACGLHGDRIKYHRSRKSSQAINKLSGPRVIISSSGMLTGGRILHHLAQRAGDPRNVIAVAGYQAAGTRGRRLLEGAKHLRFHGRDHEIKAAITNLCCLSGHADYHEIMRWLEGVTSPPQTTFVTHGEPDPAAAMAGRVTADRGFQAVIPDLGDRFEL